MNWLVLRPSVIGFRSADTGRVHLSGQCLDLTLALLPHALEVDISALHVRADQLHTEPVADIHVFKTAHQFSFDGRMQKTNPSALVRSAGDDGIEALADSRFQQHGRRRFFDLPLDFFRRVFLFGAVLCERLQFIVLIGQ